MGADHILGVASVPFSTLSKNKLYTMELLPWLPHNERGRAFLTILSLRNSDEVARDFVMLRTYRTTDSEYWFYIIQYIKIHHFLIQLIIIHCQWAPPFLLPRPSFLLFISCLTNHVQFQTFVRLVNSSRFSLLHWLCSVRSAWRDYWSVEEERFLWY